MFWRYAELWLNPYCLRTVQNRINLNVTLNLIHHVGETSARPNGAGLYPSPRPMGRDGRRQPPAWDIFARPDAARIGY
jgi:hypothetical protein